MILLRAFPLSLSILWRFILVLPLWTVFYTVITVISVFGVLSLLASIPIVGLLFLIVAPLLGIVITYIIAIHPYLIGIRIGLRVLGFKAESSQERLLGGAVVYGLVEAIVAFLFLVVITAGFIIVIQTELALSDALDVPQITDPIADLSREIAFGALNVLAVLSSIAVMALRAALLPVLAGVAAGGGSNGRLHTPLGEFGANFASMMGLLLMISAISTVVIPFVGDAFRYVGLTSVLSNQLSDVVLFVVGEKDVAFTLAHALLVLAAIILSIWLFCLQCAGAALSYESRSGQTAKEKQAVAMAQQANSQSIADLRRSRMSNNSE